MALCCRRQSRGEQLQDWLHALMPAVIGAVHRQPYMPVRTGERFTLRVLHMILLLRTFRQQYHNVSMLGLTCRQDVNCRHGPRSRGWRH